MTAGRVAASPAVLPLSDGESLLLLAFRLLSLFFRGSVVLVVSVFFSRACAGKSRWRMREMDERCDPASRARREPFDQFEAVERMRKPVTLSSTGPPPDPYVKCVSW